MTDELEQSTIPPAEPHPADIADELQQLDVEEAVERLRAMSTETASEVLSELDEEVTAEITSQMTATEISGLLEELPHDEAADIAAELSPDQQYEVLSRLTPPESAKVTELMRYPEDSAGGIMKDAFIALSAENSIEESLLHIHARGEEELHGSTYLYVVDERQKLVGIMSVRDLVFRSPGKKLKDVMKGDVHHVRVDADQEEVARLFTQYHFLALPVIERDGRLVGVVEADQVMDILQEEATEDMQLMVGVTGEESAFTPWRRAIGLRTPWLYINLATAFLAAAVIAWFESTLAQWTALAVFLPIIAGQGGNSGMQALTITIRSMALGEMSGETARRVILKECIMGILNGLLFGITVGVIGYLWKGSMLLGLIVFLAMFLNMVAASAAGVLIPLALKAFRLDPALSSSIFLTTITDVAGFFFFLGLATLLIPMFGAG